MTKKEVKEERRRKGLCVNCGGLRLDPAYVWCAKCRTRHKELRILRDLALEGDNQAPVKPEKIRSDHKCWTCEWGRFEGDRFFCPFIEGTCVKEQKNED